MNNKVATYNIMDVVGNMSTFDIFKSASVLRPITIKTQGGDSPSFVWKDLTRELMDELGKTDEVLDVVIETTIQDFCIKLRPELGHYILESEVLSIQQFIVNYMNEQHASQ